MNRIKSFVAGFLFCLLGLGIIFIAAIKGLDKKKTPSTPEVATAPTPPAGENGRIITGAGTNDSPSVAQSPNNPQANTPNPSEFTLSKNQPVGRLGAVHGVGGSHLVGIPSQFTSKNEQVHHRVLNPLLALIGAAQQDDIPLRVVSAYRSYGHQKAIWERKWGNANNADINKAREVLTFSSFPGTSRHHWGTDIDFNNLSSGYWQSGEGRRVHAWLRQNAPRFGFCQAYAPGRNGGYSDEPWHWSHMPTANEYYRQITQPEVFRAIFAQNVRGTEAVNQMGDLITYTTQISSCNYNSAPIAPVNPAVIKPAPKNNPSQDKGVVWEHKPDPTRQSVPSSAAPINKKPPLGDTVPAQSSAILYDIDVPANEVASSQVQIQSTSNRIKIESVAKDENQNPIKSYSSD